MKVCKKHVKVLRRGMTYEIVEPKNCVICEVIRHYVLRMQKFFDF